MVWITNPVTTIPIYYLFLKTGDATMGLLGQHVTSMTFHVFRQEVMQLTEGRQVGWLAWLLYATQVLLIEFGWPIVLGSFIYAIPGALLTYPFTIFTLRKYRRALAGRSGLSYEAWRERFEVKA
jgi:uncharacterized protein